MFGTKRDDVRKDSHTTQEDMSMSDTSKPKSEFSVLGLSHKFFRAFEKAGGTPADANALAEDPDLMRGLLVDFRRRSRLIDFDAKPHAAEHWVIRPEDQLPNLIRGQMEFDPKKVVFHLDAAQKTGSIVGNDLKEKLAEAGPLYGAQVLDYLYENKDRIPVSWQKDENGNTRYIYFWTIYRGDGGHLSVRYMFWDEWRWVWSHARLADKFNWWSPAAILAS